MYKGRHGLTKKRRAYLVAYNRYAISKRSQESNSAEAARLLAKDIRSSLWHVFGNHEHCSQPICKTKTQKHKPSTDNTSPDTNDDEVNEDSEDIRDVIEELYKLWTEGTSVREQEETRTPDSRPVQIRARRQWFVGQTGR